MNKLKDQGLIDNHTPAQLKFAKEILYYQKEDLQYVDETTDLFTAFRFSRSKQFDKEKVLPVVKKYVEYRKKKESIVKQDYNSTFKEEKNIV